MVMPESDSIDKEIAQVQRAMELVSIAILLTSCLWPHA